jgi:hypothetical protein
MLKAQRSEKLRHCPRAWHWSIFQSHLQASRLVSQREPHTSHTEILQGHLSFVELRPDKRSQKNRASRVRIDLIDLMKIWCYLEVLWCNWVAPPALWSVDLACSDADSDLAVALCLVWKSGVRTVKWRVLVNLSTVHISRIILIIHTARTSIVYRCFCIGWRFSPATMSDMR